MSCEPHDHRWGSTCNAVAHLLPLKNIICAGWNKESYGRVQDDDENDNTKGVKVEVVDRAVKSDLFWGYSRMCDLVGECLSEISNWSESCSCHSHVISLKGPTRHQRRKRMMAYANRPACPLTCMRAHECAAGMMLKLVDRILNLGLATLLVDPLILVLNEADRETVLKDFSNARKHIRSPVFVIRSFSRWAIVLFYNLKVMFDT